MANYDKDMALVLTEVPTRSLLEQMAEEAAEVGQAAMFDMHHGTILGLCTDNWEDALAEEINDLCMCAEVLQLPLEKVLRREAGRPASEAIPRLRRRIGFAACSVSKTALKLIRARGNGNPTPQGEDELWSQLATWTDTLLWLARRMGVDIIPADRNPKWERWAERIRMGM